LIRPVVVLTACLLAACAGGGSGGGGGGGGKKCTCDPPGCPTVSFNNDIQPIFNSSCAQSAGCHRGAVPAGQLDLGLGQSIPQTVGVKSTQQPRVLRVKPGSPDDSYLYQKITGAPGISGTLMPQGCPGNPLQGAVCLDADQVAAIAQWIIECATDQSPQP